MENQPTLTSPDQIAAYIILGIASLAVLAYGLIMLAQRLGWLDGVAIEGERRADMAGRVKASELPALRYDERRPSDRRAEVPASAASRREAEAEARREVRPEGDVGIVTLTEKALQARLDDTYQQAAIETFATLLKAGYLDQAVKDRKLTKLKELVFRVSGGRQLQALNAALDAVPVPLDEPPPPEPRQTPVAGRELADGVEFREAHTA